MVAFHGLDDKGNLLSLKMALRRGRMASAWLTWIDDEATYVLPDDVYTNVDAPTEDSFRAAGLTITVLEPFKRWRIVFNGMMR